MINRMKWGTAVLASILCFGVFPGHAAPKAGDEQSSKDLYYFVIDRSGSIGPKNNNLINPIRGAVVDFVGKLPENTAVELVFFDTEASRPKRWNSMDLASKGALTTYFYEEFQPREWTRLYDTVAEVIDRAQKEAPRYRMVNIIILSDGVDEGPGRKPISRKHTSWASIEGLAKDLKICNQDSMIYWYTLGFTPPAGSEAGEWMEQVSVNDPRAGVVIKAPAPKAAFTCAPAKVQVGDAVLFVLESEAGVETTSWSFSDGSTSTNLRPSHVFTDEGIYSVKVKVSGAGGESSAEKKDMVQVLRNVPLEASFKWSPDTVRIRQKVQFVDESLGSPDSWLWEVTGMPPMPERSPTVEFAAAGPVVIKLTIGKEGKQHAISRQLEVLPPEPIKAAFKWSPETIRVGEKVQFVDDSIGSPDSWSWSFTGLPLMNDRSPIVEFPVVGSVTATLTIEKDGQTNSASQSIAVLPPPPPSLTADFKVSPAKGIYPLDVQFKNASQGAIASYVWEFGDGGRSDVRDPVYTYQKAGAWVPRLTIRNAEGQEAHDAGSVVITVSTPPPPPPWWMKPLMYAAVALAVWVLVIVPFVIRPALAPQAKVAFRGSSVYFLRNLAGRGLRNALWPRSSVSIGFGKKADIKIGGAGQKAARFARVARVPLGSSYVMTVLQKDAVAKMVTQNTGLIGAKEVAEPIPAGRRVTLRQGDSFIFSGNVRLMWEQPSLKKQPKKK